MNCDRLPESTSITNRVQIAATSFSKDRVFSTAELHEVILPGEKNPLRRNIGGRSMLSTTLRQMACFVQIAPDPTAPRVNRFRALGTAKKGKPAEICTNCPSRNQISPHTGEVIGYKCGILRFGNYTELQNALED